jgi:nuclear transcription Y subunit beta
MDAMDDDDGIDDYMMGGQMFHFRSDGKGDSREVEIREQDRYLPIANIARIMKRVLPGNAKIAKDAKESIQECVSEFISFITSEASDKCQQEKRKTINGDDILWAMSTLGFEKYIDPLKAYLAKYRESVKGEKIADKKTPIRRDVPMPSTMPGLKMSSQTSGPSMGSYHSLTTGSSLSTYKHDLSSSAYSSASQYKWQTSTLSTTPLSTTVPTTSASSSATAAAAASASAASGHATRAQTAMGSHHTSSR